MANKTGKPRKHVPMRTCAGCRQVLSKRTLLRLVKTPEGIRVDPSGKLAGRGTYLHNLRACWEKGIKGAIAHALKTELTQQDLEYLKSYLSNLPEDSESIQD